MQKNAFLLTLINVSSATYVFFAALINVFFGKDVNKCTGFYDFYLYFGILFWDFIFLGFYFILLITFHVIVID